MYFVISEQLYMSDFQINIYNTLQLSWTYMTSIRGNCFQTQRSWNMLSTFQSLPSKSHWKWRATRLS